MTKKKTNKSVTAMENQPTSRCCKQCGIEKAMERFHRHAQCNGGRLPICRDCKYQAYKTSAAYQCKRAAQQAAAAIRLAERAAARATARQEKEARLVAAGEKTCKKCGEIKPLTKFPSDLACIGGRSGSCYACIYQTKKPHLVREKERARAKRWRQRHPDQDRQLRRVQNVRYRARQKARVAEGAES